MEEKQQTMTRRAYGEIFIGVFLLGTGPMFVKSIHASGTLIAFYRLLFAAAMLTMPAVMVGKKHPAIRSRKTKVGWLLAGGAAFAVNIALWSSALKYASAAIVTVLDNTAPVWVGLFAWLVLGHRQGSGYWIGLILALTGSTLLVTGGFSAGSSTASLGIMLSVFSGISYAVYILVTQQARRYYSSMTYSWMVSLTGAAILLVFGILSGALAASLSLRGYGLIFLLALCSQVLGWYLVNDALGKLPSAAGAVALVGQPVLSTLLGIFILGELLTLGQWAGVFLCLAGILLAQSKSKIAE